MMNILAQITSWINVPVNMLGGLLLSPVAFMPGWLSNTIVSVIAGIIGILIFKYTSNQKAYGRVKDRIKANMIALKLFKDSVPVILNAQARVFKGAMILPVYAVLPMLVMIIPIVLLWGQLGLWYQARPLLPSEETIITMQLQGEGYAPLPEVSITSIPGAAITAGPVRVLTKREIYWKIKAREKGYHNIVFQVDGKKVEKRLSIGDDFMRMSIKRPGLQAEDIFLHPMEKPFGAESVVQSIAVQYPDRPSKTSGTNWWMGYFILVSLVFGFLSAPLFKVRI